MPGGEGRGGYRVGLPHTVTRLYGMVLIGMPRIEKRVARLLQYYSRIGFVHEFRPLQPAEMTPPLERRWTPTGVTVPDPHRMASRLCWKNLARFARTLQGAANHPEGNPQVSRRRRCVEGSTLKHHIAQIHATSMKRLSKIEAADEPEDGAEDE